MAEETYSAIEMLMRLITKNWVILMVPFPGVALKIYLDYKSGKTIEFIEAAFSAVAGLIMGYWSGSVYFLWAYKPEMTDAQMLNKFSWAIVIAMIVALMGEKVMLYLYDNLFPILDNLVYK